MIVALELAAVASLLVGFRAQLLRWLRVAQREHYLAGSVQEFRVRWTRSRPINLGAGIVSIALLLGSWVFRARFEALSVSCLIALGAIASLEPRGLTVKGRTSALAMTQRLRRVLLVTIGLSVVVVGFFGLVLDVPFGLAVATVGLPATIDNALRLLAPVERRSMQKFVDQAASTLRGVQPTVVAITGSYGKTSTKLHLTQLLSGSRAVVATPASFNNRGGLARAINEHLSYGTEVFIAEMGTYGPGEIADLCSWIPPDIAVMSAIGPVHLERFGSLEVTLQSKAEITVLATTVVLNVDDPMLATLVEPLLAQGKTVIRCSTSQRFMDVTVEVQGSGESLVFTAGQQRGSLGVLAGGVQPINVALALGVASALGVDLNLALLQAPHLVAAANRSTVATTDRGVIVIDDTFNANPAGANAALSALRRLDAAKRVVVTPGMIELGPLQAEANTEFAREAATVADLVVIVGFTNRRALLRGVEATSCEVQCFATRDDAVDYIRTVVDARDAVLYENDLPDHYP